MPRMLGNERGSDVEMQEWTPGDDPMLALLPPETPWAFQLLPREEQRWRARVFLAVWINTGGLMFAWAQALRNGPDDADVKAWVLRYMTDEVILDGLRSLQPSEPTTPSSRE
jgi:hypothetical protein